MPVFQLYLTIGIVMIATTIGFIVEHKRENKIHKNK